MTTTSTTRLYVHGTGKNQRSTARQLVAGAQNPIKCVLDLTIEIYDERDVIMKTARYALLFFVRSSCSLHRYFVVTLDSEGYKCTCGKADCKHARQAHATQQEKAVA
jgi:hypothetical protein